MRTQCPHCCHRFDVPHRAVLAEAARLQAGAKPVTIPLIDDDAGNRLTPAEIEARKRDREHPQIAP